MEGKTSCWRNMEPSKTSIHRQHQYAIFSHKPRIRHPTFSILYLTTSPSRILASWSEILSSRMSFPSDVIKATLVGGISVGEVTRSSWDTCMVEMTRKEEREVLQIQGKIKRMRWNIGFERRRKKSRKGKKKKQKRKKEKKQKKKQQLEEDAQKEAQEKDVEGEEE